MKWVAKARTSLKAPYMQIEPDYSADFKPGE